MRRIVMKLIKILIILFLCTGCIVSEEEKYGTEKKVSDIKKVSFVAVGDNIMHDQLINEAKINDTYDFSPYYASIKPYIETADLAFVNQETILGGEDKGYSGYPLFNTPDELAKTLSDVGFDIVNGATNHAIDQGESGITHSINVFKKYNHITYIGLRDSDIPVIEKNGIKIAFLSYNQFINYDKQTDSLKAFNKEIMQQDVENAKEISDVIIVSCHYGIENSIELGKKQQEYSQYLADLGVNVIIGTHSHTLQPVTWLKGKEGNKTLVAYSLGNFISGMLDEESQLGGMLSFDIMKDENIISIENATLTPLVNHYRTTSLVNIIGSRYGFQVYRLKDYTSSLENEHGLNGYQGISISIEEMKQKVKDRVKDGINIDM